MRRKDTHGTRSSYVCGCRCAQCKDANATYRRKLRAGIPQPRATNIRPAILCTECDGEIIGYPDGWMHTADRRRIAEDGHEAQPAVIA